MEEVLNSALELLI